MMNYKKAFSVERQRDFKRISCLIFFTLGLLACSPDAGRSIEGPALHLSIEAVSGLPHLVSGGDALVDIVSSSNQAELLQLTLNDVDISPELAVAEIEPGLYRFRALVSGLQLGNNRLKAKLDAIESSLPLVNYPITGPIISGPHQTPYFCLNELSEKSNGEKRQFAIGNGEFLDDAVTDAFCSLPTRIDYVYRSNEEAGEFKALTDLGSRPVDLAYTRTMDGSQVPYIVRLETGTINRAIYQIAVLHDVAEAPPSALQPSRAWNERLIYTFGGGCEAGYFQGDGTAGVLRHDMLAQGYAVASSTLNVNAQGGCNDVLSAETAMMVKEHFIETYGAPVFTIGSGGSGGAMQQLLIAGAYPGILDGLLPSLVFADAVTYFTDAQECASLFRDYANDPSRSLDETTKTNIGGWSMWSVCEQSLGQRPKRIAPDDCSSQLPPESHYHPQSNPEGVRCSIYDGMKNIFGTRHYPEGDGTREFARAPHDNVGVQYGLAALNEGLIDKAQFLDLNENIGGWDINVASRRERTGADVDALRAAYQTGRVTSGGAGLSLVPIIDDRPYLDDVGDFHASVYSFVTRERLLRDNGHADNYVLRRHQRSLDLSKDNLALMDLWLSNIEADRSGGNKLDRVVRNKPAELENDCFAPSGERIIEAPEYDTDNLFDNTNGVCNQLFPPHAGLRLVAGGPLSNDVLKCQLKPIDDNDYAVSFSDAEKARLQAIFSAGVCDWSKPGVEQQVNQTWLSFGPSPVNRYR